jgi:hypothetical protein
MKTIKDFVKNKDIFGSSVTLRYGSWERKNVSGDLKHKSVFGGIISIFSNFLIYGIFLYFLLLMVDYDSNKYSSYVVPPNWE